MGENDQRWSLTNRVAWSRIAVLAAGAICVLATTVLMITPTLAAPIGHVSEQLGSSCAHPWQARYQTGGHGGGFEGDQSHIAMSGEPRNLTWDVKPGNLICSVRIQLGDGQWVRPTKLFPYRTPTPIGGEYQAPSGAHSPLKLAVVTAARSPVPPGTSCNYPVYSTEAVDGAPGQGSDTKDFGVNVRTISETNPGEPIPGAKTTLSLVVTVHDPRVELCHAYIAAIAPDFSHEDEHLVHISSHGGESSAVTIPATYASAGIVYARLR